MVGWILLGLLGVIVLAFFVPVSICVEYLQEWRVRVRLFGVICVWSFPVPEKPQDKPPQTAQTTDTPPQETKKKSSSVAEELKTLFREDGIGGVMHLFAELARLFKTTLVSLVRFVTIRKLALCVRVGGEEADEIATRYGQLSAALAASLTVLSQAVRIKKPCVRVVPDFTSAVIEARLRMTVWVWPFGAVAVAVVAFCKFLLLWTKTIKTPRNGVTDKNQQPVSK